MAPANAVTIVNGGFNAGLTGFSIIESENGTTDGQQVVLFETVSGINSTALELNVGRSMGGFDMPPAGITLVQQFIPEKSGLLTFSVDVAAVRDNSDGSNANAGEFTLLSNGAVLDTLFLGEIEASETLRGSLSGKVELTTGVLTDFSLQVFRPFVPSPSLRQYVDNVVVSTVPLPAPILSLLASLVVLFLVSRGEGALRTQI